MPPPKRPRRADWRWKVADPQASDALNLLYEPGNWGDVLKGLWACAIVRALHPAGVREPLRYLDPFAGAPTYPLVPGAARRLELPAAAEFRALQGEFLEQGRLASTALLVHAFCRHSGRPAALTVFDADAARREAWRGQPETCVLELATAAEGLSPGCLERLRADFILVDPYDFLEEAAVLLPLAAAAASGAAVLVYLYNKAPRSSNHWQRYRRFREALAEQLPPASGFVLGRVPSDAILPRAYHEVLLLAPRPLLALARPMLEETTCSLAAALARQGAWEVSLTGGADGNSEAAP